MSNREILRKLLERETERLLESLSDDAQSSLAAFAASIRRGPIYPGEPVPLISVQPMPSPIARSHYLDLPWRPEPSAVDQLAAIVDEEARQRLGDRRIKP